MELLHSRYLRHTNRLRYVPQLEGQTIDRDGSILIGDRAGPECNIRNLVHELGHFVEIDDARTSLPGWGLRVPHVWIYDRYCVEPTTMSMIERELRTIAYQTNVLHAVEVDPCAHDFVSALRWMEDFIFVPLEDGRSAYGADAPKDTDYSEKIHSRIRWMEKRVEELRLIYTLTRFEAEYARKIQMLQMIERDRHPHGSRRG